MRIVLQSLKTIVILAIRNDLGKNKYEEYRNPFFTVIIYKDGISTYINTKCVCVCLCLRVFLGHFVTDWETIWHTVPFSNWDDPNTKIYLIGALIN